MIKVFINGNEYKFKENISILKAARMVNIEIPTLCYDERLKPSGNCRLCLVEVKGEVKPVPACNTLIRDNMEIQTHTESIENFRRDLLKLLALNYPANQVKQFPGKILHRYFVKYGVTSFLKEERVKGEIDNSHPYISVNWALCIYCLRCVRICEEVQGQGVWRVYNKGFKMQIKPGLSSNLMESLCVGCGACVTTCPTGALEDKTVLEFGEPEKYIKTICAYCGVGCEINAGVKNNKIITILPAEDSPVNKGHLCVKGRYAYTYINASDRITVPLIKEKGEWFRVSLEEVIKFVALQLRYYKDTYGADSIAIMGSSRATNEENYLIQKFARGVLGTNNVDCCARVCHAPTASALREMVGTGAATNSFNDIEYARTILVCGANPTENHPVVGARIKRAVKNGANLIVVDPRKIELANYATIFLQIQPGTDIPLFNAMCYTIIKEKLYDEEFINSRVNGFEEFCNFLKDWTPEKASKICGVPPKLIKEAARMYSTYKPSYCVNGLGLTEYCYGTDNVCALINLALLTGNIGKLGCGINPLRGQNNVQGAAHMGCEPSNLTGFVNIKEGKELFEKVWGLNIPTTRGLNAIEIIDSGLNGNLKLLWLVGYDILLTHPDVNKTRNALKNIECVIVQDIFLNETAKEFGKVFIPVVTNFEKDGTYMNAERRVQRIRKVISSPDTLKSDWEIICLVAKEMGYEKFFNYNSAEEIWNEIRKVWKAGEGISWENLETGGIQWPATRDNPAGTAILHTTTFPKIGKAHFKCIEFKMPQTNKDYPFKLITGRTLYQFNAGTFTMRTNNKLLRPVDYLEISPRDAKKLKLRDGDRVKVKSKYGECVMIIKIDPRLRENILFATFHSNQIYTNMLTGCGYDRVTKTPQYKLTFVAIEKV